MLAPVCFEIGVPFGMTIPGQGRVSAFVEWGWRSRTEWWLMDRQHKQKLGSVRQNGRASANKVTIQMPLRDGRSVERTLSGSMLDGQRALIQIVEEFALDPLPVEGLHDLLASKGRWPVVDKAPQGAGAINVERGPHAAIDRAAIAVRDTLKVMRSAAAIGRMGPTRAVRLAASVVSAWRVLSYAEMQLSGCLGACTAPPGVIRYGRDLAAWARALSDAMDGNLPSLAASSVAEGLDAAALEALTHDLRRWAQAPHAIDDLMKVARVSFNLADSSGAE